MDKYKSRYRAFLLLASCVILLNACEFDIGSLLGSSEASPTPALSPTPSPMPSETLTPPAVTITPTTSSAAQHTPDSTLTLQAAYGEIDQQFSQSLKSSLAFNKPEKMKKDETANIELILNPSVSQAELATQIVQRGGFATSTSEPGVLVAPGGQIVAVETGSIEITPRMKAVLKSQDSEAFAIAEGHDNAEQVLSTTDPTIWRWSVTAKKEGKQTLELVVYRLIKYDEKEYWHEVETYKANIVVEVSPIANIKAWDWQWIASAILIPLAVAIWGWLRKRKNDSTQDSHPRGAPKKNRN